MHENVALYGRMSFPWFLRQPDVQVALEFPFEASKFGLVYRDGMTPLRVSRLTFSALGLDHSSPGKPSIFISQPYKALLIYPSHRAEHYAATNAL